jgi:hypothetical protein
VFIKVCVITLGKEVMLERKPMKLKFLRYMLDNKKAVGDFIK